MDYNALVILEFPVKPGTMPVIGKQILPSNRFKFTIKIDKLGLFYIITSKQKKKQINLFFYSLEAPLLQLQNNRYRDDQY